MPSRTSDMKTMAVMLEHHGGISRVREHSRRLRCIVIVSRCSRIITIVDYLIWWFWVAGKPARSQIVSKMNKLLMQIKVLQRRGIIAASIDVTGQNSDRASPTWRIPWDRS